MALDLSDRADFDDGTLGPVARLESRALDGLRIGSRMTPGTHVAAETNARFPDHGARCPGANATHPLHPIVTP
ncbi:hypothetical protein [Nocardioides sp. YIM 152315]|uniref:hypothetical protein n=1 Tax=Nocardioides sp. YIM 152315 TaxID=3031760 RepID=UPI0023DC414F|nr:hypothetical protein [Nocardioides sp. YIM 152315]MDF1605055.1 hypothetical protein [Nocardioides sp. YIM 152315]